MLLLIFAGRDVGRAIDEDIGRHQVRIGVKADGGVLTVLAGFFLELGHAVEPAEAGDAIEDPGKLRMGGNTALGENDRLFRIDPGRDIGGGDFAGVFAQLVRILPDRDRVHIDGAIDALIILLQSDEVADRTEIVAKMQVAARLNAGKNTRHYELFLTLWTRAPSDSLQSGRRGRNRAGPGGYLGLIAGGWQGVNRFTPRRAVSACFSPPAGGRRQR